MVLSVSKDRKGRKELTELTQSANSEVEPNRNVLERLIG